MAAPTEVYVDPAIAANSGAGTIGDPYGDLQYALDTVTRDATNGDRFNIKAGTDEVLSSALSLTTYGSPTLDAPLIFQGYTSTAGDGGIGGISGGGSVSIKAVASEAVYWRDLHLHNTGSNTIVATNQRTSFVNCEFDNTTGSGVVVTTGLAMLLGCHFHNIATYGVSGRCHVYGCYFANGTNDFTAAILADSESHVSRNIISIDGTSDGIVLDNGEWTCIGNSILSNGGSGQGIDPNSNGQYAGVILNNLVEGFTGGIGIRWQNTRYLGVYGSNAVYNCATPYSAVSVALDLGDNETLSASPFAKSGSNTFANRFTYFAPVPVGNVIGGAYIGS